MLVLVCVCAFWHHVSSNEREKKKENGKLVQKQPPF